MGLFDQMMGGMMGGMLGNMLSKAGPDGAGALIETLLNGPMAQALPGILNGALAKTPYGSIEGVLARLREAGLGHEVDSWISTEPNVPVSADEIVTALGPEPLEAAAGSLGLQADMLPELLAKHLPTIIDHFSPNGVLELPGS
ncbi:YidB family protein [Xanthobacter sp. KR7-65]|uniref:YidB family protein n=1 Tax=Xanthobacter sp. KR7-65 TaxID=3156612 RepID=UPI0032B3AC12